MVAAAGMSQLELSTKDVFSNEQIRLRWLPSQSVIFT
jgi:hypothetical protein